MMKHKGRYRKLITTIGIIACFTCKISFSQTGTAAGLQHQTAGNEPSFREKMYVHTDKSFYMPGEIIWFKVYCLDAASGKPAGISKVADIEVLNNQNKPVLQAKVALEQGMGSGSFMIPSTVNTSNYLFRAYTNWMRNFGTESYFQKQITIVNAAKRPDWQSAEKTDTADVQFFPEGGDLVSGIESKIAFRVVNLQGKGIDCKGYIISPSSDTVVRFKPSHFGIGNFYFTPVAAGNYKAVLKLDNGKTITVALPKALQQGYVMRADDSNSENVIVTVTTNTGDNKNYLVISMHQQILTTSEERAKGNKTTFIVGKKNLKEGISTFTILNSEHEPVCERLYFKQPQSKKLAPINVLGQQFATRAKVNVALQIPGDTANAKPDNLSMSVYLVDSLQKTDESDIATYLWLSSELKGTIESPSYYLNTATAEAAEAGDNLMLTHGWRRFANNKNQNSREFLPEYEGQVVKAIVTNRLTKMPEANVVTYLSIPGEKFSFSNAVTNKNGEAYFSVKDFYGNTQAIVQANNQQDSNYLITVAGLFSDKFGTDNLSALDLSDRWKEQLRSRYISSQVQSAFAAENLQKFSATWSSDSTAFYGTPDKKYFLDDYTRFPTMEEVLHEYVANISLRHQGKSLRVNVWDIPNSNSFKEDPLVLLDGVPVFNFDKMAAFDPLKIKKLEVVARKYYTGNLVNRGILSYSTYNGDLADYELDANALVTDLQGLQIKREFFSPVYDNTDKIESPIADARNLLFWSPDITVNAGEKKELNFYTSDLPGTYAIVIQGISKDGPPVSDIKMITVKN